MYANQKPNVIRSSKGTFADDFPFSQLRFIIANYLLNNIKQRKVKQILEFSNMQVPMSLTHVLCITFKWYDIQS